MDPITLDQFAEELREIAAEDPDRRNPADLDEFGGCAYRMENEDGSVSRCLIGEWLHRKGYETRDYHEGSSAHAVMTDLIGVVDKRVLKLAAGVQRFVDSNENDDDAQSPRMRWIEVKPVIDMALEKLRNDV